MDDPDRKALKLQEILRRFNDRVDELRNAEDPGGNGLTAEFRTLLELGLKMREENTHPCEEGKKSHNLKKNRFRDILPFDETRVTLQEKPGEEGSDYINANFILDIHGNPGYIASQGPVKTTINDFWRMLWQYEVKVVAMACRLVEMGKRKCEQYWPTVDEECMEYGDITVTIEEEEDLAEHCTVRKLQAEKGGTTRHLTQFHYTGWPDHDIPTDFDVVLEMIAQMRKIKAADYNRAPMVVHCSAGCGRTGTICAIDFAWDMLKMGKIDDSFSLYDIIKDLRDQRQSMIQTPEQYEFAHITVQQLFQKHLEMMEDHIYGNIDIESENADDVMPVQHRKASVLVDDITQTLSQLYDTVYPTKLPEPLVPTQYQPQEKLPEPLVPTPTDNKSVEAEKVVSPSLKDRMAVFSVEKIENIPNQKPQLEKKPSIEIAGIQPNRGSIKSERHSFKQSSFDQQTPSRGSSVKSSGSIKVDNSAKGETHTVVVNKQQSFSQHIPSRENSLRSEGSIKGHDQTQAKVIQSGSTQVDGKHVTVLSIGGKPTVTPSKSVPLSSKGPNLELLATKSKTLPTSNFSSGAIKLSQSKTLNSSAGTYSYAQPVSGGTTATGNQQGSLGNSQFYSVASEQSGEITDPAGQTGSPVELSYSVVSKPGNRTDISLSSTADSSKTSQTHRNGNVSSDGTYESVSFKDPNVAPSLPHRGYLEPEPSNHQEIEKGNEETNMKKKNQLISGIKTLFGKQAVGSGSDHVVPSDIPGYNMKVDKKPKGPRNSPAVWIKK